ncbi:YybH family protein [Thiolapillus sp.]
MKPIYSLLLSGLLALSPLVLAGMDREADHRQLRQLMADASAAINQRDMVRLRSLLAEEFVITMVDQQPMTEAAQLDDYIEKYFVGETAPLKSITVIPEADAPSRFIGDDVAIAHGHSSDIYVLRTGAEVMMPSRWTATLVRQSDGWKIAAFHAGVNPLDNPILAAAQQNLWTMAAAGAVTGALLMLLLMRLFGKRN